MIQVTVKYIPFLIIDVQHTYFSDKQYQRIWFEPEKSTSHLLANLKLVAKVEASRLQIAVDAEYREVLYHYLETHPSIDLLFWLKTRDQYFNNISQLATNHYGQLLYFHNQYDQKIEDYRALHQEAHVSSMDFIPKEKVSESWYKHCQDYSSVKLYGSNGELVMDSAHSVNASLPRNLSPGQYHWALGDDKKYALFNVNGQRFSDIVGAVQLSFPKDKYFSDIKAFQSGQEQTWDPFCYLIRFQPRYTYWKYIIIPKYTEDVEGLQIKTGEKEPTQFKGPTVEEMPNGQKGYCFISQDALPLQEISPYNFQLVRNRSQNGNGMTQTIKRLPTPSFERIRVENLENKIYSDILVFI